MAWTRVSNGYHLLLPDPPTPGEMFVGNFNFASLGSVQEMAGSWWKARVFAKPGRLHTEDDLTHRFEEIADAKAWVAVTCKLGSK